MCGIAGVIGRADDDAVAGVERMIATLSHRGPDGSAVRRFGDHCVLGHARLAILDLSDAADQPLGNETDDVFTVFNGEIYNFKRLRRELANRGHTLRSNGDTEVIVHAYEEWGAEGFVERLDGMFAFALYDCQSQRLVLARDRSGKKPLFFARHEDGLWFASEPSALRAAGVPMTLDPFYLPAYLTRGYVPSPATLVRGMSQLEPGSAQIIERDHSVSQRRYWQHPATQPETFEAEPLRDVTAAVSRIRAQLRQAVEVRLASDVPLGAFLSGGIDSAAVVALAQRISGRPLQTFTIGFEGPSSWDEREGARATALALGSQHHEHVAGPEEVMRLAELVARCGEPLADPSIIPTHLVSRLAREAVTVVLTGDGGDELFAGYRRFLVVDAAGWVPRPVGKLGRRLLSVLPDAATYAGLVSYARRFAAVAGRSSAVALMELAGSFTPGDALAICGLSAEDGAVEALAGPERRAMDAVAAAGGSRIHGILAANFAGYLPGDLLRKADRATMATSLEARAPLLDTQLIHTAARCSGSLLLRRGKLKWLLKQALADVVPPEVLERPKHGFGIPVGLWMRGPLRDWTADLLTSPTGQLAGHLDGAAVAALWAEHLGGTRDHGLKLWGLCALETWLRWARGEAVPLEPPVPARERPRG